MLAGDAIFLHNPLCKNTSGYPGVFRRQKDQDKELSLIYLFKRVS
jgi:hypothetical protein